MKISSIKDFAAIEKNVKRLSSRMGQICNVGIKSYTIKVRSKTESMVAIAISLIKKKCIFVCIN